jgi:hypothetical protein
MADSTLCGRSGSETLKLAVSRGPEWKANLKKILKVSAIGLTSSYLFWKPSDNTELRNEKGRFLNDFEEPPRLLGIIRRYRKLPSPRRLQKGFARDISVSAFFGFRHSSLELPEWR